MSRGLTKALATILIPEIPAGSDIVYWRTTLCLASDRKMQPELDDVASLFLEAAEKGLGQLYQRRRPARSKRSGARQPDLDPNVLSDDGGPRIIIDYCFRKLD